LWRDISAVKRDDARLMPALDEGQKMHASVPEIDVHQVRAAPRQEVRKHLVLAAINNRGALFHPFQPAMPQRIARWFGNYFDVAERKQFAVLQRFRHHESVISVERPDLAVDVQHLRFQESGAVAGYNWLTHEKRDCP